MYARDRRQSPITMLKLLSMLCHALAPGSSWQGLKRCGCCMLHISDCTSAVLVLTLHLVAGHVERPQLAVGWQRQQAAGQRIAAQPQQLQRRRRAHAGGDAARQPAR